MLKIPFASTVSRLVDSSWNATNEEIQSDTHEIRTRVTKQAIFMYAMMVASWFMVYFLPKQRLETQELKRKNQDSSLLGAITLGYMTVALFWSIITNLMGIFPETGCLVIAGGTGC